MCQLAVQTEGTLPYQLSICVSRGTTTGIYLGKCMNSPSTAGHAVMIGWACLAAPYGTIYR